MRLKCFRLSVREDVMTLRLQAGSGTLNLNAARTTPDVGSGRSGGSKSGPQTLEQTEAETLQRAITAAHGNLSAAARLLNTTRPKLAYRARKHGLID